MPVEPVDPNRSYKNCEPAAGRVARRLEGSQTSPRRYKLPTSPHRLKLREAASGKPGGFAGQATPGSLGGRK